MSAPAALLTCCSHATSQVAYPVTVVDMTVPGLPITFCNAAFEELTGWPREEAVGRNCRFLQVERAVGGTEAASVSAMVQSIRKVRHGAAYTARVALLDAIALWCLCPTRACPPPATVYSISPRPLGCKT